MCIMITKIGVDTVINNGMIWHTGKNMRIQDSIIRQAGCKRSGRFEKGIKRHKRFNIGIHIDTPVFKKNTEAPEVRFDGGIGNSVKDAQIDRRIVTLQECATLCIPRCLDIISRIQCTPLIGRLRIDKFLCRVTDVNNLWYL